MNNESLVSIGTLETVLEPPEKIREVFAGPVGEIHKKHNELILHGDKKPKRLKESGKLAIGTMRLRKILKRGIERLDTLEAMDLRRLLYLTELQLLSLNYYYSPEVFKNLIGRLNKLEAIDPRIQLYLSELQLLSLNYSYAPDVFKYCVEYNQAFKKFAVEKAWRQFDHAKNEYTEFIVEENGDIIGIDYYKHELLDSPIEMIENVWESDDQENNIHADILDMFKAYEIVPNKEDAQIESMRFATNAILTKDIDVFRLSLPYAENHLNILYKLANSKETKSEFLEELLIYAIDRKKYDLIIPILKNINAVDSMFHLVYENKPSEEIIQFLLRCTKTPKNILNSLISQLLYEKVECEIPVLAQRLKSLAYNISIQPEIFSSIRLRAKDIDYGDRPTIDAVIAGNISCPLSVQTEIINNGDVYTKQAFAKNTAFDPDLLASLLCTWNEGIEEGKISSNAALNPSTREESVIEHIDKVTTKLLKRLLASGIKDDKFVPYFIERSKKETEEDANIILSHMLEFLTEEQIKSVIELNDVKLFKSLCSLENISSENLDEIYRIVDKLIESNTDNYSLNIILPMLLNHGNIRIETAIKIIKKYPDKGLSPAAAENTKLPQEIYNELARNPNQIIQGCLARNIGIGKSAIMILLDNKEESITDYVACLPQIDSEIIEIIEQRSTDTSMYNTPYNIIALLENPAVPILKKIELLSKYPGLYEITPTKMQDIFLTSKMSLDNMHRIAMSLPSEYQSAVLLEIAVIMLEDNMRNEFWSLSYFIKNLEA